MAISGEYIDPRVRELTAHAIQRYAERHCSSGDVAANAQRSVDKASPLYEHQRWWLTPSYWINNTDRLLFVCRPFNGCLKVVTVMRADSDVSISNPVAAKALKAWRKSRQVATQHLTPNPTP